MRVQVVCLGTGPSEGVPKLFCVTKPGVSCRICKEAAENQRSRNRRRNCSLLLRLDTNGDGEFDKSILIDVGKTFSEGAKEFFPKYGLWGVDAVLLTHKHIDHVAGLDDLFAWSHTVMWSRFRDKYKNAKMPSGKEYLLPIYCRNSTEAAVRTMFPWLFVKSKDDSARRFFQSIQLLSIEDAARSDRLAYNWDSFRLFGLDIVPISVEHGNCDTIGFRIGDFAYIPDWKAIPESEMPKLERCSMLILDAFIPFQGDVPTHATLPEALDVIRRVRPRKTYITNMSHLFSYEEFNPELQELRNTENIDVEMAFDGLELNVEL